MPILQTGLATPSASSFEIEQSLRFEDGDSPVLNRTGTSADGKTFTISVWVKRGNLGQGQIFSSNIDSAEKKWQFGFDSNDRLSAPWVPSSAGSNTVQTTAVYRDPAQWYHIVWAVDTTQATSTNRIKLYVNGVQVTNWNAINYPSQNQEVVPAASSPVLTVGSYRWLGTNYDPFDGYLAEFHYIDGQALTSASFGETDSATNQWVPIEYTGSYGTNGFYQKYSSTELANSFTDSVLETTWTAPAGVTSVDYLVVGGGGGGGAAISASGTGYEAGGGGGAGGLQTGTLSVTPGTTYSITVGAGGTAGSAGPGGDGGSSTFATITANGGGGGGKAGTVGRAGGSGGGAGSAGGSGGSGSQGNSGGSSAAWGAGGGGGHSASGTAGDTGTNSYGGPGGNGTASSLSGSSVTYAGGGGGGSTSGSNNASGGSGGGGAGGSYGTNDAVAGTDNTGGGGGGAGGNGPRDGAAGGSGIVILYDGTTRTSFTTVSPTQHTITANGDVTNTRAQKKIGSSSIKFDGTGDYLSIPDSTDWDFGTGALTVECWVNFSSKTNAGFVSKLNGTGGLKSWSLYWNLSNTKLYWYGNGGANDISATWNPNTDQWYHVAVVRSSDTTTLYIDGTSIGSGTTSWTNDAGSSDLLIGREDNVGSVNDFDGYMDEIRVSDTARYTSNFTPSTTAFTADSNTKLLIHSDFDGGLGADSSGNTNDFSATNLVATDQMTGESPTNNFATLNPAYKDASVLDGTRPPDNVSFAEGNLSLTGTSGNFGVAYSTMTIPASGKWYLECYLDNGDICGVGIVTASGRESVNNGWGMGAVTTAQGFTTQDTYVRNSQSNTLTLGTGTPSDGDIYQLAIDADNNKVWIGLNNSWNDASGGTTGNPSSGTNHTIALTFGSDAQIGFQKTNSSPNTGMVANFGQDSSFAGAKTSGAAGSDFYYTPPTGFKALCSDNLPDSSISDPTAHFNTVLYTGDDSTDRSITGVGFQPDFVAIKARSVGDSHADFDSVRGRGVLHFNAANAENTTTGPTMFDSFDSDGFTISYDSSADLTNRNSQTYVAWNWKAGGTASSNTDGSITSSVSANTTSGFSIVAYTGTGSNATVGHGLSTAPELVIVKSRTGSASWFVYSKPTGASNQLRLNGTDASTSSTRWQSTAPTSSVFSIGNDIITTSTNYIAYCFHSVDGYSKVGSYSGNGSSDGTFIYTGFRPAFVMIKRYDSSSGANWILLDIKRDTFNIAEDSIYANLSNAEEDVGRLDFVSNGFKLRQNGTTVNTSSGTYIYLAFAESPFKTANAR